MVFKRNTVISEKVLNIFNSLESPINFKQLLESLNKDGISLNKSTLYRILDKLIKNEVISAITLQNTMTYYEKKQLDRHAHFQCTSCEKVICVNDVKTEFNSNINANSKKNNFTIHTHEYTLYGHCKLCSAS